MPKRNLLIGILLLLCLLCGAVNAEVLSIDQPNLQSVVLPQHNEHRISLPESAPSTLPVMVQ